jgi:serine/threonine-protein kinase
VVGVSVTGRRRGLSVGDVVGGRFSLVSELGEGGMSRVYEALDLRYDRSAAVKVLARWLAEDEEFRQRFERESVSAERVTHPHVLPIWDHGEEHGQLFLATPLCDIDLGELITSRGQLELDRTLSIIAQVAWALDWAHGRGVVHRDVKPENVLLITGPGSDHAYLADFGLARANRDETLTQAGHPAGLTPAYAAPEQWRGEAVGPAADQYALAATLFTCLAGHPPFHPRRGPSLRDAHLSESPPELHGVVGGIPDALAEAVNRGLAKSPSHRFGTCGELVAAAQTAAQRARQTATPHPSGSAKVAQPTLVDAPGTAAPPEPAPSEAAPSEAATPEAAPPETAPPEAPPPHTAPVPAAAAPPPSTAPPSPPAGAQPQPPAGPLSPAARPSRSRGPLVAAAVALAAVVVIALAALLLSSSDDSPTTQGGQGAGAGTGGGGSGGGGGGDGDGVQQVTVGSNPRALAAGEGGLWVANSGASTVTRIAPRSGEVRDAAVAAVPQPFGVAVAGDRVWVVGGGGELAEIEARTGKRVRTTNLRGQVDAIGAGPAALWLLNDTAGTVTRVDVSSGRPVAGTPVQVGSGTSDIAVGLDAVWVTHSSSATLTKLDSTTGQVARTINLRGAVGGVAVDDSAVWVANPGRGKLIRVDPKTGRPQEIAVGGPVNNADVAAGDGAVFYVDLDSGTATRFDPATRKRAGSGVRVATNPGAAVVAGRALWVTDIGRDAVARLTF